MSKIIFFVCFALCLMGEVLDFNLIKMPTQNSGEPRVLILSGIQGDEPGGFNATNLFLQHYKILSGEVWVIPNLNQHSILRNHRGIYGDMNRKFKTLDQNDEEFDLIQKIKLIVLDPTIQVIYHLHDGGGFYRKEYINNDQNPNRWGNCSIIDQEVIVGAYYENLLQLSEKITQNINQKILKDLHRYRVRNTHTKTQDKEMEKSLTYFAITHGKTALANEASKNLPLYERVYYHLLGVEGMLRAVGVKFQRDFELTPNKVYALLYKNNSYLNIENLIKIPLFDLRSRLLFFPLPKDRPIKEITFTSDQYIVGFLKKDHEVVLKYGNRVLSTLSPFNVEFSKELSGVEFEIDGSRRWVKIGEIISVKDSFLVLLKNQKQRVNIIGFQGTKQNEAYERVGLKNLLKRYSLDKKGRKYRVEFYDDLGRFLGMVVVDFV
ncbi:M99 family carboxypeptidase catalytic domain-containing protein [Helicobacter kayseriensis]|uniref:M99 family carboxypeptidase catalytic domain-containing protein n=1 Tax=Helicobacter kayseriensis TaxID=2905877 RepID=UPI001E4A3202|nr:M99 family carboxypeptidase catalytic domain-containing protein [Helicobacter kayseriensis]MCE3047408.1 purine-nucleoside phosphorylase [Helicobacter kayseriensis]MCE3048921.1 purine-nucleoside phosphorylase [Helicobacter kayseriensis]